MPGQKQVAIDGRTFARNSCPIDQQAWPVPWPLQGAFMLRIGLASLFLCSAVWGDVVHLKDGTQITGTVKRVDDQYMVIGADGKIQHVDIDKVDQIDRSALANPSDDTM